MSKNIWHQFFPCVINLLMSALFLRSVSQKHLINIQFIVQSKKKLPQKVNFTSNIHEKFLVLNVVQIRVFSGPYFPAFGLNPEIYGANLCIQSKYRKIWTRKTPYLNTFNAVVQNKTQNSFTFMVHKENKRFSDIDSYQLH